MATNGKIQIERLEASSFEADPGIDFEDVNGLHKLYDKLAFKGSTILVGPKGIGKSLSVAAFAADNDYPLITFDCSEDVRRSQLLGHFILKGDETPFVLGPLTTAFEVANEVGHCVLVLEEINALSPQCQKILNPVADFRRRIEVPEAQRVFKLEGDAKLWVVGTMNTAVYGGVYELNEDLKSRFDMIPLSYPNKQREERIIKTVFGKKAPKRALVNQVLTLAHETRQGQLNYALSSRDVVSLLNNITAIGLKDALWISTGKFEDTDRPAYAQRVESIFGIDLSNRI